MSRPKKLTNAEALANLRPEDERLDSVGVAELVVDALCWAGVVHDGDRAKAVKIVAEEITVRKVFGDLA